MYSYSILDVNVHTIIDRRREKRNGMYPVKVEIQSHRKQCYVPVGIDLREWPAPESTEAKKIRLAFNAVKRSIDAMVASGKPISDLSDIKQRIIHSSSNSVNAFLEERLKLCFSEGRINSYYRIRNTLRAIERFNQSRPLRLKEITPELLKRLEGFWLDEGKSSTTINIYMRTIKCAMRDASEAGLIDITQLPFGPRRYEAPPSKQRKTALTAKQVLSVIAFKGSSSLEYYRDLWLFSYLCNGINFRDMLFLRFSDITGDEISFVRSKTRSSCADTRPIRAYITPAMREIMERHGNNPLVNPYGFIFPYARERMSPIDVTNLVRRVTTLTNRALKQISENLGLPPITTYTARHTFATVLKRQGIDISYISECLGHTSIATTEVYLSGFEPEDRRKYSALLTEFGKKIK